MKGLIFLRYKKYAEAVEALSTAVQVAPTIDALVALGEGYLGKEDGPAAIETLEKVMALNNRHPQALFLLGYCFKKSQQFSKACIVFRAAERAGAPGERCSKEFKICRGEMLKRIHTRQAAS